ncbi:MAG TPA: hypothetical protein VHL57_06615, partial [Flavobacteriales bacterium]|nr:hypothetical protein [Flavobacteriales bacterium]
MEREAALPRFLPTNMRLLAPLLAIALLPPLRAQELQVHFNSNDCINCITAATQLALVDTAITVRVLGDAAKATFLPALLEQHGVRPSRHLTIAFVPGAEITAHSPTGTMCTLVLDARPLLHFPLKELGTYLPLLPRAVHNYDEREVLPIHVDAPLSDRVAVFPADKAVLLDDHLFRRTYIVDLQGPRAGRLRPFAPDDAFVRRALRPFVRDVDRCDTLAAYMATKRPFEHEVVAVDRNGGDLQLIDHIRFAQSEPDGGVLIDIRPMYLAWQGDSFRVITRCNWVDIAPYMMVNDFGFFLEDRRVFTSVIKRTDDGKPWHLIAEWDRVGDSLAFHGFGPLTCPPALLRYGPKQQLVQGAMREGLYATTNYPLLYDLRSEGTYDLAAALPGNKARKYFHDRACLYWAMDQLALGNDACLLAYQYSGVVEVVLIDLRTRTVLRRTVIDVTGLDTTTIRLLDDGRLVALT